MKIKLNPTRHEIKSEYEGEELIFVFDEIGAPTFLTFFGVSKFDERCRYVASKLREIKGSDGQAVVDEATGEKVKGQQFLQLPYKVMADVVGKFLELAQSFIKIEESEEKKPEAA